MDFAEALFVRDALSFMISSFDGSSRTIDALDPL